METHWPTFGNGPKPFGARPQVSFGEAELGPTQTLWPETETTLPVKRKPSPSWPHVQLEQAIRITARAASAAPLLLNGCTHHP